MPVTSASASRVPAGGAAAGFQVAELPYGYATEQEGSGVVLAELVSTPDAPAERVTVKNVSNQPVASLRFVVAVERWVPGRAHLPVRLFTSADQPVSIAAGAAAEVAIQALTAAQLDELAAEPESAGTRMQLFIGLSGVRFANGHVWAIRPNPTALAGSEALNNPRPLYSRALIERDAGLAPVTHKACYDERQRATSHGGLIPILNEPGRFMRCDHGRWVEWGR
jgi:hypothetical protein